MNTAECERKSGIFIQIGIDHKLPEGAIFNYPVGAKGRKP